MLNHTYTSVKNANLVDCGKKQHIPSQPTTLLKDNFLGEFRTELDKKKVLANLGIATELSLEWEYIKGDIGRSEALIKELDSRTKYISEIDGFQKTLIEGINYLETVVGGEQDAEKEQDDRLKVLEESTEDLNKSLEDLKNYLKDEVDVNIETLTKSVEEISEKVENITELIKVSNKEGNALVLLTSDDVEEGEDPGLYVPDLSPRVTEAEQQIETLQKDVTEVQTSLENFVTRDELGGGDFDFVNQDSFDSYTTQTDAKLSNIQNELGKTVKTGEDGHVDTLYVNKISKNNNDDNIKISDSFEVENGIPLDVRFVVPTRADLAKLNVKVCYAGMGVIVKDESALYILREPFGGKLTQEFIEDLDVSWKCPEDLVTQALTRAEYEELLVVDPVTGKNNINPSKFYYVYEEDTTEPNRSDFTSDEAYQEAYNAWLKILSQEYMSAAWGVDIENKVAKKANQNAVDALNTNLKDLQEQLNQLSGGDSETSLSSLAERVSATESNLNYLLGTEGSEEEPSEKGKIVEIEESITELDTKLSEQYVSKNSITDENNDTDYIFVKKSEYAKDVKDREDALSKELVTKTVTTDLVETDGVNISNLPVTSNGTDLLVNDEEVALIKDVPKIIYLTQAQYDALNAEDLDPEAYYYTTDEEIYVIKTDFDNKIAQMNTSLAAVSTALTQLQNQIQEIQQALTTLTNRVDALENTPEEGEE